jgi:nucleoside triphosphatase
MPNAECKKTIMIYRTTVSAVIKHKPTNKYLLVKQPANRGVYPGQWAIPGGGIDLNETMYQALQRECREEVGIEIDNIVPLRFDDATRIKRSPDGPETEVYMIMLVFTCETTNDAVQINNEAEEYAWVELDQVLTYDLNPASQKTFQLLANQI